MATRCYRCGAREELRVICGSCVGERAQATLEAACERVRATLTDRIYSSPVEFQAAILAAIMGEQPERYKVVGEVGHAGAEWNASTEGEQPEEE